MSKVSESTTKSNFAIYDKLNYILMGAGAFVILIGYLLMSGGRQEGAEFNVDEIYSARRIVVAPIVIVIGFAVVGYGVLKKPSFLKKGNAAE